MDSNTLSLAEKKWLLSPSTGGIELLNVTLFELILRKGLRLKKTETNNSQIYQNGFLKINKQWPFFQENIVFAFIQSTFDSLPQLQLSRYLKLAKSRLNNDFENFKEEYVLKSLVDQHGFIETGILSWITKKVCLTRKGEIYQKELIEKLHRQQKILSDGELNPQLLQEMGPDVLLLGHNTLQKLKTEQLYTALIEEAGMLMDVEILSDFSDFFTGLTHELYREIEGLSGNGDTNVLDSILPDFDIL
ncbi:hypothetical protein AAG747_27425 [Rapidithrix thailandica]|uniref:DUF4388 domain-containing protein n=1 Tax=Rapidithrix thailandica TaxID=413964 RepID=A0AAW9SE69_9BACT